MLAGMLGALALVVGVAGPAAAANKDGVCEASEFCLFYQYAGQVSSFLDFRYNDPDHRNDRFKGPGAGYNATVADNVRSAWNRHSSAYGLINELLNCSPSGAFDVIVPGELANVNEAVRDNNWSNCWTT
ncbi:peptidase inhibitor family I36 protein [Kribbella caucasensis]|uniref:peptidase inhibitor family I36 protein n=1 Tax=Kribbella caucasensis TaxID=2512215 RepID=UPI001414EEE5|nr:peptidase inhibitor family I36 protein [Kribbella sp. VKM Ac-2527]